MAHKLQQMGMNYGRQGSNGSGGRRPARDSVRVGKMNLVDLAGDVASIATEAACLSAPGCCP